MKRINLEEEILNIGKGLLPERKLEQSPTKKAWYNTTFQIEGIPLTNSSTDKYNEGKNEVVYSIINALSYAVHNGLNLDSKEEILKFNANLRLKVDSFLSANYNKYLINSKEHGIHDGADLYFNRINKKLI